jgi:beta-N-acetylhexosaminidase
MQTEESQWVDGTLSRLSLDRKIAQMLTVGVDGRYAADDDPRLESWLRLVCGLGVGGIALYGGTPRDVAALANRLQRAADVPLLVSSDFEGGPGQQVAGASEFPANMALAAVGSDELTYRVAVAGGVEGRAMGIRLNYSPVADIAVRPDNPAESVRSFGGDLELVGRMIRAYVRGYHEAGMLTTAKHFPGRGDVTAIPSRPRFSQIDKRADLIEAQEFRAFRHAIEAGVDFVMTEHIAVPSITGGSDLPASVEPKLVTGWLRERLAFTGVISSDDLWYDHVVDRFGRDEVAVAAVKAGHDVVLKPRDPAAAVAKIVEAVRGGEIAESRIDESVRRILDAKARLGLHRDRLVDEAAVGARVGTQAHRALVQEVADRSLTLLKNDGVLPLAPGLLASAVNISIQKADNDPSPAQLAEKLAAAFPGLRSFFVRPDTDPSVLDQARAAGLRASLVIFSLFVPRDRLGAASPIRNRDASLIADLAAAAPGRTIAMSYGNPYHLTRFEGIDAFAVGYGERGWFGNQAVYFDSFIRLLTGALKPQGRSPVHVSESFPRGTGLRL